jgi:hypothetical protein
MDTAYPPIRNTFKPCFSSWLGHGHQVYFNPKDTLLFSDLSTLRSFLPAVTREDGQQVRFIALNPTFFSFPQNGLFSSMTAVNYADCILQSAFVLMNVLETLGNVEEITFLVPEFSDEDILDISSAITILRTGLEAVVAFSPDPAQWGLNEVPKIPKFMTLRCRLDSEGLEEAKEHLVSKRLAADRSDWARGR